MPEPAGDQPLRLAQQLVEADGDGLAGLLDQAVGEHQQRVAARDRQVTAEFLATILGLEVGAPYGPLPPQLRPTLSLSLTFSAVNPAVRPRDPKNGPVD